eukprot:TRINITY_DN11510_c0_g3_i1.p1 TRINITY_DN11510_c0_g3~~TRINITY_DN11510_c0_g3_i1.p1  ORF type:complete len:253 (+),score=37.74 TRINITY_DN11510_c0_g3_i1:37-759(+)
MADVYKRKSVDCSYRGDENGHSSGGFANQDPSSATGSDAGTRRREGHNLASSGGIKHRSPSYVNLTPWVMKVFFVHTYYAYIYVFYMFVLAFYKGYALEYPYWRHRVEMVLIMLVPFLQHLRFYFGYWGCELGMPHDLCVFLLLCSVVMVVLMYFLFFQAYIMPLDSTFLFAAVSIVAVEGVCGAMNALQLMKLNKSSTLQLICLTVSVLLLFSTVSLFIVRELLPHEAVVQELRLEADV